jgi:hypothetical protein
MFRKTPFLHKNVSKVAQDAGDLDNIDKKKKVARWCGFVGMSWGWMCSHCGSTIIMRHHPGTMPASTHCIKKVRKKTSS